MAASSSTERSLPRRSVSWPVAKNEHDDNASITAPARAEAFEEHLESHPEDHFLSPMQPYEYEDWSSESEFDDDDEHEWDAGITDFALFGDDRRQAEEHDLPLPSKWNDMLAQQASALKRADERSHGKSKPASSSQALLPPDNVPGLTPDASPNLVDDLDADSDKDESVDETSDPKYFTVIVTPPDFFIEHGSLFGDEDEDLPLFLKAPRKQAKVVATRRLQRPGLLHSRTLSGRRHSWRRPDPWLYTVGEEREVEVMAE